MAAPLHFDRLTEWLTSVSDRAGVPNACLHLLSDDGRRVVCQAVSHGLRATHLAYGLDLKDCAAIRQALAERRAVPIDDAACDPRVAQIARRQYGLASVLYQPVLWRDRRGILILSDRTRREWSEGDLQFAAQCAEELVSRIAPDVEGSAARHGDQSRTSDPRTAAQRTLLDSVPGMMLLVDEQLMTVATSAAIDPNADLNGQSAAVSLRELLEESDRGRELRVALQDLFSGERDTFEGLVRTVHGLWWVHAARARSSDRPLAAVQVRPGVELPEAIQRSEETRRLESLGRLASSVAHEINNALQIVRLAIPEYGERWTEDGMRAIEEGASRATRMASDLLTFAGQKPAQIEEVDLAQFLGEREFLLRRVLGPSSHLDLRSPVDETVTIDVGRLDTAMVHLVKNAADASPYGGTVTVSLSVDRRGEAAQLVLEVIDDGEGIDEQLLERWTAPGASDKRLGFAAGLGLSIVREIADDQAGVLEFDRASGRGTRARLILPIRSALPAGTPEEAVVPLPRPESTCPVVVESASHRARILVVEDEDALQRLFRRMLERQDYEVIVADSCESAMARLTDRDRPLDLALIDLTLPDGSGVELFEYLDRQNDMLPVVLMSGYAESDALSSVLQRGTRFLSKPFGTDELLDTVRQTLSAAKDAVTRSEAAG